MSAMSEHLVLDGSEVGSSRAISRKVLTCSGLVPIEVLLLAFIENSVDQVDAKSRSSGHIIDAVESRSDIDNKLSDVGCDRMGFAMEDVDHNRPGTEFFEGNLSRGREQDIGGGKGACIGERHTCS